MTQDNHGRARSRLLSVEPRGAGAAPLRHDRWVVFCFLSGLVLSISMALRSQVAGDQLLLLARGWQLAFQGEWVFLGMPMSGGGHVPGGLTSLLVGLPLAVWPDHRAATLLVVASHVVAYLVLDSVVASILGTSGRRAFAVLYWLNPWRIYHSAFLWTPNLLLLLGALHFWTIFKLRKEARFWPSLLHVLVLGAAVQIHPSVLLLVFASAILLFRGYFRIHQGAVAWAALLIAVSLTPWALLILRCHLPAPFEDGKWFNVGQALLGVLRGIGYWLRYPSFKLSQSIACLDFSGLIGRQAWMVLMPLQLWLMGLLGWTSLALPLWANRRLWSRARRRWTAWRQAPRRARAWLEGVIRWSILAAVVVFLLSPTTIMSWQVLLLFHLTVLLAATQVGLLLRSRHRAVYRRISRAWLVASLGLSLVLGFGSPPYRSGGERCGSRYVTMPALRSDHPMFDDLGIRGSGLLAVNQPGGWWPDVLEERSDRAAVPRPRELSRFDRDSADSQVGEPAGVAATFPGLSCSEGFWRLPHPIRIGGDVGGLSAHPPQPQRDRLDLEDEQSTIHSRKENVDDGEQNPIRQAARSVACRFGTSRRSAVAGPGGLGDRLHDRVQPRGLYLVVQG